MISSDASAQTKYRGWLPWLFTVSFIIITFLPRSMDDVMFMDGVTYASIARNMSEGIGSFWRPFFAHSFWLPYDNGDYFSGHPPLQFGLQSLLFRVMGDTPAVENFYNLLILIGSILLIAGLWRQLLAPASRYLAFDWLPVVCWYGMSIVWYSIPNNFLDSTMGLFCLASCYCQLLFLKKPATTSRDYIWPVLAGLLICMALLTKGPVGLYPLAFSVIYSIANARSRILDAFRVTGIMLTVALACFGCIFIYGPAREFLSTYFNGQVVQALLQKREKAGSGWQSHFMLLTELIRTLTPHITALIALYLIAWGMKWRVKPDPFVVRTTVLTALVAASGILPMLLSIKQYPHYLVPALPFVALTLGLLLVQRVALLMDFNKRLTETALCVAIVACWGATIQKVVRLENNVHASNAKLLRTWVPVASTIGICHEMFQNADVHANLQRYHHLSLTTRIDTTRYILADSACLLQFDLRRSKVIRLHGNYWLIARKR